MTINSDKKFLNDMLDVILKYRLNSIKLRKLINDLDALINLLSFTNENLILELQRLWGALEDVYADMLYMKKKELDEDMRLFVEQKIGDMELIICVEIQRIKEDENGLQNED